LASWVKLPHWSRNLIHSLAPIVKKMAKKNRKYYTDRCSSQMDRALDLSLAIDNYVSKMVEKNEKIILKYAIYLISRFKGRQFVKCTTLN
jgi:hypothetical protein